MLGESVVAGCRADLMAPTVGGWAACLLPTRDPSVTEPDMTSTKITPRRSPKSVVPYQTIPDLSIVKSAVDRLQVRDSARHGVAPARPASKVFATTPTAMSELDPAMLNSHLDDDDSDSDWEYEYHDTETEVATTVYRQSFYFFRRPLISPLSQDSFFEPRPDNPSWRYKSPSPPE